MLAIYSTDIKDMYHVFRASLDRALRNTIKGDFRREELETVLPVAALQHLPYGVPIAASIQTQVMGDHNGCEFAQEAILHVAMKAGTFSAAELMSHSMRPPRGPVRGGNAIDDIVLSEEEPGEGVSADGYPIPAASPPPSCDGQLRIDKLEAAYNEVGLTTHPDKRDVRTFETVKWGLAINGITGLLHTPWTKVIYTCDLVVRIVELGVVTAALLESVVGCVLSFQLVRRRLICLVDLAYDALRGCEPGAILHLSPLLKQEMLSWVITAPLAWSSMRATPPERIYAVDASKTKYAAVEASFGTTPKESPRIGRELLRHCPRKGAWNKLLSPIKAWERAAGIQLGSELPAPAEAQSATDGIWPDVIQSRAFTEALVCPVPSGEHINISELRALALAEALAANEAYAASARRRGFPSGASLPRSRPLGFAGP